MPRPPNAKPLIERAALRLFVEKGVDGTSIRDVAAAAGVSEGALYRHYDSKDALVWALFAEGFTAFARRLDALQAAAHGTRARLKAMIEGVLAFHDAEPLLFRFLLFVQHRQLEKVTPDMANPIDAIRNVVRDGIARGDIRATEPELATAMAVGLVLQPATFAAYGRIAGPLLPHAPLIAAAAWNALTASPMEGPG
jgi:AcrR family transcriptional regulator